jgi:hypothetical protein
MGFHSASFDEEGTLKLSWRTPAFRREPHTGEELWFNSVVSIHW